VLRIKMILLEKEERKAVQLNRTHIEIHGILGDTKSISPFLPSLKLLLKQTPKV
jgi:hypothetical protein